MPRGIRLLALVALVAALPGCAYTPGQMTAFFRRCPASGPVDDGFARAPVAIDLDRYYAELRAAAGAWPVRVAAEIDDPDGARLPLLHVGPVGGGPRRLLVVAGVHGNEAAAVLAAPRLLQEVVARPDAWTGVALHLVAPGNPVGVRHRSRYDAAGCDVNRDFDRFATPEARAIRDVFDAVQPDVVVSLHEGPHAGFFAFTTIDVPPAVGAAVVDAVAATGMPLAEHGFLPLVPLDRPGLLAEGRVATFFKRLVPLGTLAAFAHARGVGDVTTETSWSSPDLARRIEAHVAAVGAVARTLPAVAAAAR